MVIGDLLIGFGTGSTTASSEALFAEPLIAIGTDLGTAATETIVAVVARFGAVVTQRAVAGLTAILTVTAERAVARVTAVAVFGRDDVAAGGTVDALPFVEFSVSRSLVIGPQDLANENEELADETIGQGRCDGLRPIPFTQ